ncbi:MAG: polysaccharide deacetylase family protein [Oscillospiraceae bacterium]|nr:polysaccharide deacetylase family protein [Oscillospiraceae bacterium]
MKKLLAVLLTLLLLFALIILPAQGETIHYMVVNYTVSPFDYKHRPVPFSKWGFMIPHTALTAAGNGLNIKHQWSEAEQYFTIYNDDIQLTFVYNQSTAFSGSERWTAPLWHDTGVYYLPITLVCEVFGLTYEGGKTTEWGTMVRISSGAMNDDTFIKTRGEYAVKPKYDDYIQSQQPSPEPSRPSPVSPSPSSKPPEPSPSPEPLLDAQVYLTFDGAAGASTARLLDFLESERLPALFFLPPESLAGDPDSARRIAARHQIGLLVNETEEETLDQAILRGNELLRETVFIKTWLLRSDNAPLDSTLYRFWGVTHRFSESDSAQQIVSEITPLLTPQTESPVRIFSLPHSDDAVDALAELLPLIGRSNIYRINPGEPIR